jgi:hypothetical protein
LAQFGGNEFVDLLRDELDCENDNQLALRLGSSAPNVHSWRKKKNLTKTIVRNVVTKLVHHAVMHRHNWTNLGGTLT